MISPSETYLASARIFDTQILLWSIETGEIVKQFDGHDSGTHAVAFSADEQYMASVGRDGQIKVWDVTGQQLVGEHQVSVSDFHDLRFSGDDDLILELDKGRQIVSVAYDRS